jgi:hypothetical protein
MNDVGRSVLEDFRTKVRELAVEHGVASDRVEVVSARPLSAQEAIGSPERSDFPILTGKEFMMEARFRESRGQAFTSMPGEFSGTVDEILGRELKTDFDRALLVATANALIAHLGLTNKTVHCKDDGPKRCAAEVAEYIRERYGAPKIAFIGFQPAMIEALSGEFSLRVTDMDEANVGKPKCGVLVEGVDKTSQVIDWADVVLVTGTCLANGTLDGILSSKPTVFYGVTIAGMASLCGHERYCPCGI